LRVHGSFSSCLITISDYIFIINKVYIISYLLNVAVLLAQSLRSQENTFVDYLASLIPNEVMVGTVSSIHAGTF
jgi:hypothetical protein